MITQETLTQLKDLLDDMRDDLRRYAREDQRLQEPASGVHPDATDPKWVYNTDAKPLEDILRNLQFGRGVRDIALLERWAQALETHSIDDTVLVVPPEGPAGMSEEDRAKLDVVIAARDAEGRCSTRTRVGGTPEREVTSTPPPVDSPTPPNDWGAEKEDDVISSQGGSA